MWKENEYKWNCVLPASSVNIHDVDYDYNSLCNINYDYKIYLAKKFCLTLSYSEVCKSDIQFWRISASILSRVKIWFYDRNKRKIQHSAIIKFLRITKFANVFRDYIRKMMV